MGQLDIISMSTNVNNAVIEFKQSGAKLQVMSVDILFLTYETGR